MQGMFPGNKLYESKSQMFVPDTELVNGLIMQRRRAIDAIIALQES